MIYAGTGHRPSKIKIGNLDAYDPRVYRRLIDLAGAAYRKYSPTLVISGMAEGWDQAMAEAAIEAGIPFHAYVPHEGQERRWSPAARKRYQELLSLAEKVVLVSEGPYQAYKMQRRNVAMVDNSDCLFSLYDGTPGGTANCLEYAELKERKVVPLWSHWQRYAAQGLPTATFSRGRSPRSR